MQKKEMVAMILAGGQGSRLKALTKKTAKPAVPFGGKYRIIDFALSNCSNSNIDTVGVLTQYRPLKLNTHIGIGTPWDLDRSNGGVSLLPPYMKESGGDWYKGTANAIYQNRHYIDSYDPEYVLVLSGDHIYKMDYAKMLDYHKEKNADATIAVIEVSMDEASRFGIMNTNEDDSIYEFDEKPEHPKNNKASMGIYIFNWKVLKNYLKQDELDDTSENDFGKNIIPKMVDDNLNVFAYNFEGYWRDVGTIQSLWDANMDLLDSDCTLNLYDKRWAIYSVNPNLPPQYAGPDAVINNSIVVEGCKILGKVKNSIIFSGVTIGKGSTVTDSIIMNNVTIGENVVINKAIIGAGSVVHRNAQLGCGDDIYVVGDNKTIEANFISPNIKEVI